MKPGQPKSSGMHTQLPGDFKYDGTLNVEQHGRECTFLSLKSFAMKNASTTANLILRHPQRITHIGIFCKVCSIYYQISLSR